MLDAKYNSTIALNISLTRCECVCVLFIFVSGVKINDVGMGKKGRKRDEK